MTTHSDTAVFLHYRDDGPSGPCGQSCSITNPWSRIYVYENEDDARALMRLLEANPLAFAGRRRPRIEMWWFGEHVQAGPIVPEDQRA